MMTSEEIMNHWRFFLSLERDFIELQDFIEITPANFNVYSLQLSKILQSSCAEIDSVLRLLCSQVDSSCNFANAHDRNGKIHEYSKVILKRFPDFKKAEIFLPHLIESVQPWSGWSQKKAPDWWRSYNLVKHYRHSNFSEATLKNVIHSMCALMLAILYLYRLVAQKPYANPSPTTQYFSCEYLSLILATRAPKELPSI